MKSKITTSEIWENDKEYFRKLKVKHGLPGLKEVFHAIRKLLTKHKMEDELKWLQY